MDFKPRKMQNRRGKPGLRTFMSETAKEAFEAASTAFSHEAGTEIELIKEQLATASCKGYG